MSKYVGFEDQFDAYAAAHREALEAGLVDGKLYVDGFKVSIKDGAGILEVPDDYEFLTEKYKLKEKLTIEDAEGDKVEKVKAKVKVKAK